MLGFNIPLGLIISFNPVLVHKSVGVKAGVTCCVARHCLYLSGSSLEILLLVFCCCCCHLEHNRVLRTGEVSSVCVNTAEGGRGVSRHCPD